MSQDGPCSVFARLKRGWRQDGAGRARRSRRAEEEVRFSGISNWLDGSGRSLGLVLESLGRDGFREWFLEHGGQPAALDSLIRRLERMHCHQQGKVRRQTADPGGAIGVPLPW